MLTSAQFQEYGPDQSRGLSHFNLLSTPLLKPQNTYDSTKLNSDLSNVVFKRESSLGESSAEGGLKRDPHIIN